ncbi:hypothetical protein ACFL6K_07100, partial [Candidatus Latescibacterota bacterium]
MEKRREGFMIFFFVAVAIMMFVYSYVGLRIVIPVGLGVRWNVIITLTMLCFLALPFISIALRMTGHQNYFIYVLTWISYLSLGFVTLVFLFLLARDILLFATVLISKTLAVAKSLA